MVHVPHDATTAAWLEGGLLLLAQGSVRLLEGAISMRPAAGSGSNPRSCGDDGGRVVVDDLVDARHDLFDQL